MASQVPYSRFSLLRAVVRSFRSVLILASTLHISAALAQFNTDLPRIAHAGGQVNGATYTNSFEALNENYAAGFRAFEIDLSFTSDRELVCLHDWEESFTRSFGLPATTPIPLQEFEQLVIEKSEFSKCTLNSLLEWFARHMDALLITDIKEQNIQALEHIATRYPQFLARIIPQIYQPAEYETVKAFGFENVIWTLYLYPGGTRSVLNSLSGMTLYAVTMNTDRAQTELPRLLADLNVPSYAHTVNNDADLLYLRSLGVDEIYTDSLNKARETRNLQSAGFSWQDSPLLEAKQKREEEQVRRIEDFFRLSRVLYSLENTPDLAEVSSNQLAIDDSRPGLLEIDATGSDPYIIFPALPDSSEEIQVYIDIDVPDDTVVEVFYTTRDQPDFSADRRVAERISAGENRVVIDVTESSPVTMVRLDPGTIAGDYTIRRFEVRSDKRSIFRLFPWN